MRYLRFRRSRSPPMNDTAAGGTLPLRIVFQHQVVEVFNYIKVQIHPFTDESTNSY